MKASTVAYLVSFLLSTRTAQSFTPVSTLGRRSFVSLSAGLDGTEPDIRNEAMLHSTTSRRHALQNLCKSLGTIALVGSTVAGTNVPVASAKDELFKANPLTNPVLEKIRIWEQAEADDIQYGGELAPGEPIRGGTSTYAKLLLPILGIEADILSVDELVHEPNGAGLAKANEILSGPQFEKLGFKKRFNAFADNIYYSDPDRANAYLGGGAVPKNEQSIAYLLRNDILTNLEALQAEVAYLIKEQNKIDNGETSEPLDTVDLYTYAQIAKDGMKTYLDLVPPPEIKMARELIASSKK
eukprot:scaffold10665_cov46-Attheya_sp.AAC.2